MNNIFDKVDNPSEDEDVSGIDDGNERAQHGRKDILSPLV